MQGVTSHHHHSAPMGSLLYLLLGSILRLLVNVWLTWPKARRNRGQTQRLKEVISSLEYLIDSPAIFHQGICYIYVGFVWVWLGEVNSVAPKLCPHVSQEVSWNGSSGLHHFVTIVEVQLVADISMQLFVYIYKYKKKYDRYLFCYLFIQRLQPLPGSFHLLHEGIRLKWVDLHFSCIAAMSIAIRYC